MLDSAECRSTFNSSLPPDHGMFYSAWKAHLLAGLVLLQDDRDLADAIAIAGETVGLPWTSNGQKRYVGGILPIGDIMVGYSQNAKRWLDGNRHQPEETFLVSPYWRWPVHLWSSLFFMPTIILMLRRRKNSQKLGVQYRKPQAKK